MCEGKNIQVRRPVRGLFVTLIALAMFWGLSCTKRKKVVSKKAEAVVSGSVAKKAVKKDKKKPKPKKIGIEVDISAYMHRVNICDKTYFSHINPNSIDDWQTPIPLGSMQSRCDQLIVDLDELMKKYMFYGPAVDEWLFQAGKLADYYRLFLARSKNMSVRKKLPWKKEVSSLKKQLREISRSMREKHKALDWKRIKTRVVDPTYLKVLTDKYLKDALKIAIVKGFGQAKKKKAVFLYTMKFESILLTGLTMQKDIEPKLSKSLETFASSYKKVVTFFSGNYFDHLKDTGRQLKRDLRKTGIRFNRALRGLK